MARSFEAKFRITLGKASVDDLECSGMSPCDANQQKRLDELFLASGEWE